VGINNAQLLLSFFCYYKQNLENLIVENTGLENLKPQFGTGHASSAPSPKIGVEEERESSENQIFGSCIGFMVSFEASNSTVPLRAMQNLVPYYKM
jgi:hypothetical protein